MSNWKCELVPKGRSCPYEQFQCLKCCTKNLSAAVQQLRWSLPFGIGKHFKTYEHKVECDGWKG